MRVSGKGKGSGRCHLGRRHLRGGGGRVLGERRRRRWGGGKGERWRGEREVLQCLFLVLLLLLLRLRLLPLERPLVLQLLKDLQRRIHEHLYHLHSRHSLMQAFHHRFQSQQW